jgi:hypothetical protein
MHILYIDFEKPPIFFAITHSEKGIFAFYVQSEKKTFFLKIFVCSELLNLIKTGTMQPISI